MNNSQLAQSLHAPLQKSYLIHGDEELLRIEAVDMLRAAAQQQGYRQRTVYTAEGSHFDWNAVLAETQSMGLFSEQKWLEIHIPSGKPGKSGGDALCELAERLPDAMVLVLVLPKLDKAQQQSKWFGAFSRLGAVVEAQPITGHALPAWIRERLRLHRLDIESDALTLFAERVEGNLLAAKQEIDKLLLLYEAGHLLQTADIEQAIAQVARFDVFQLSSAWMAGDMARVARLLDGLQAEGDEPVLMLWSVAEDIRTMIRLAAALRQGKTVAHVRNELRLWGDKAQYAAQAAYRFSAGQWLEWLQECAKIDRQIKGAEDGNAWDSLRHLLMRLSRTD